MAYALRSGTRVNQRVASDIVRARNVVSNKSSYESLSVSKDTTLQDATINNHLTVSGDAVFNGNVNILGTLSTNLECTGNLRVKGSFEVEQNSVFIGDIDVGNNAFFNQDIDVAGNVTIQENLDVVGNSSIGGNFDVNGNTTISGNLAVLGDTIFAGNIDLCGDISMNGGFEISGDLVVNGNIRINKTSTAIETVFIKNEVVYTVAQDFEVDVCFNQNVTILDICDGRFWSQVDASFNKDVEISENLILRNSLIMEPVRIGVDAGKTTQGDKSISIGFESGNAYQDNGAIAIGYRAGNDSQGPNNIAVGYEAGKENQSILGGCVAIGFKSGELDQGSHSIAIGEEAGNDGQGVKSIAIGYDAAKKNQGDDAISIGTETAIFGQSVKAIAIGYGAGTKFTSVDMNSGIPQPANSIVINATDQIFPGYNPAISLQSDATYINPIRGETHSRGGIVGGGLWYNTTTKEVCYQDPETDDVNFKGDVVVDGSVAIRTNLGISGDATIDGNVLIGTNLGISGDATIDGSVTIGTNLGISGDATIDGSVTIGTNLGISGDVAVDGNVLIGTNLGVSGDATIDGNVTIGTNLGISGDATIDGMIVMEPVIIGSGNTSTGHGNNTISIGYQAGLTSQGANNIAIGYEAGKTNQSLDGGNVAIGYQAGLTSQGENSVAIGKEAGKATQGNVCVAIGPLAGNENQSEGAIAIGFGASLSNQNSNAISIGRLASSFGQGAKAIAIGYGAGTIFDSYTGTTGVPQPANSIVINATDQIFPGYNPAISLQSDATYINPIRGETHSHGGIVGGGLWYNTTTKEVCYQDPDTDDVSFYGDVSISGDGRVYGDFRVDGSFNIGPASITMWEDNGRLIMRETNNSNSMIFDFSGATGIVTNNRPINAGLSSITAYGSSNIGGTTIDQIGITTNNGFINAGSGNISSTNANFADMMLNSSGINTGGKNINTGSGTITTNTLVTTNFTLNNNLTVNSATIGGMTLNASGITTDNKNINAGTGTISSTSTTNSLTGATIGGMTLNASGITTDNKNINAGTGTISSTSTTNSLAGATIGGMTFNASGIVTNNKSINSGTQPIRTNHLIFNNNDSISPQLSVISNGFGDGLILSNAGSSTNQFIFSTPRLRITQNNGLTFDSALNVTTTTQMTSFTIFGGQLTNSRNWMIITPQDATGVEIKRMRIALDKGYFATEQHPVRVPSLYTNAYYGLILSSNSKYINTPTKTEAHIYASICEKEKDKNVYGIYTDYDFVMKSTDNSGEEQNYSLFIPQKTPETKIGYSSSGGEGQIWVCNIAGNIEAGDFLCSSPICGVAMKQDDDLLHNYTIFKSAIDCDFTPHISEYPVYVIDASGNREWVNPDNPSEGFVYITETFVNPVHEIQIYDTYYEIKDVLRYDFDFKTKQPHLVGKTFKAMLLGGVYKN